MAGTKKHEPTNLQRFWPLVFSRSPGVVHSFDECVNFLTQFFVFRNVFTYLGNSRHCDQVLYGTRVKDHFMVEVFSYFL